MLAMAASNCCLCMVSTCIHSIALIIEAKFKFYLSNETFGNGTLCTLTDVTANW